MQLDKLIILRRSKRKYINKPVPVKKLGEILDLARYAPSAGNLQNWKFIVVTDQKTKEEIARACLNQLWMTQAPILIVIAGDLDSAKALYHSKAESYTTQSCANAAMLMQLKAVDLGLATAPVASFDYKRVQRILEIRDNTKPYIILTLGYSGELSTRKKMIPLNKIVFFDKYGNKIKNLTQSMFKNNIKKLKNLLKP